jgi:hypothetical protein
MKTCAIITSLICLLALAATASAQGDMVVLRSPAFAKHTRPDVPFKHDEHNEKAKLDDCAACHHGGKDGKIDRAATTEGTPCAECHPVKAAKGTTPLMRAFHKQCQGCHETAKKGPVACGECHVKK